MRQLSQCQGKKQYISYDHAFKAIRCMNKGKSTDKLNVYKCSYCNTWHVGPRMKRK